MAEFEDTVSSAFKACIAVLIAINEINSRPQNVRDLVQEITTLSDNLRLLAEVANADVDLAELQLPLSLCEDSCDQFRKELQKCVSHQGDNKKTFRGWAKLKCRGESIDQFKQKLAPYKATFNIAADIANLRQSRVTMERLEAYRTRIETTSDDLQYRSEDLKVKIQSLVVNPDGATDEDKSQLAAIRDDQLGTKTCADICKKLSGYLNDVKEMLAKNGGSLPGRTFCSNAGDTLTENSSVIKNYATGDNAIQYMVSSEKKALHGENRGYGSSPTQFGCHCSEPTIITLSKDIKEMRLNRLAGVEQYPGVDVLSKVKDTAANWASSECHGRYGSSLGLD